MRFCCSLRWPALPALAVLIWAGCVEEGTAPLELSSDGGSDTYFLSLPVAPNANMEALYQGLVVRDPTGCLRLHSPDDATVVWPFQFRLETRGEEEWVLDAEGKELGAVGHSFRLGGGEVPYLHEGLGFSATAIEEAHTRCPGRFWIVGEVS